ncbi:MAG: beta-lactamase family protein [Lewinella sp.]|nr:beta-lactamase family protein [Lewinella sp.]
MIQRIALILVVILLTACERDEVFPTSFYACGNFPIEHNPGHPGAAAFTDLLNEIVSEGVPGMMLTVHDDAHGYWSGAAGFADLASGTPLEPCHLTRVGSTVKTFTAVSILLLAEDGLLSIDDPVSQYLSAAELDGIRNAGQATIRQLLQHASGIYNYIQHLGFQTASLNDLEKVWQPEELLGYARGADPYFAPGADVRYSNTNYILLGMIIEKVTGQPFYAFFRQRIFEPLGLNFTRFAAPDPVPAGIIRGYVDFYSNLDLINATYYSGWDYFTADGGLIANAHDLNVFLTRLFDGDLLSAGSLETMLQWQAPNEQAEDGFATDYGLGIFRIATDYGPAYIHSGDAIGYFASMVYFPDQDVTITWAVNGNYGKIDQFTQSKEAMERIFQTVLE